MAETSKAPLSRAEVYAESVLARMRETPGDCDVFDALMPHLGNNPLIAYKGAGGSFDLVMNYIIKLQEIHAPHCKVNINNRAFRKGHSA